jgi:rhomboid family GlyGly-CTERM serine protease
LTAHMRPDRGSRAATREPTDVARVQLRPVGFAMALAMTALLLQLFHAVTTPILEYDRAALAQGQWWRLATGHLVHLSWAHLWLNLAGLALIWVLFRNALTTLGWIAALSGSMFGVSLGLLLLQPNLVTYVGLSGVLHGLMSAGATAAVRRGERAAIIMLVALGAKIGFESVHGAASATEALIGGRVVTAAHLYGAISGILVALAVPRRLVRQ